jgi:SAM-dependent methyltransferase
MNQLQFCEEQTHWDQMGDQQLGGLSIPLWRCFCDQLHRKLLRDWTCDRRFRAALKTDLFDEAVGEGLAGFLLDCSDRVEGIDVSAAVVQRAAARHPRLMARVSDVRRLSAFPSESFDLVVSNSTLDHFVDGRDLGVALGELARVLTPGGLLFVTLDNPQNPVVSVRNRWSSMKAKPGRLIPYFMGHTVSMSELQQMLGGLELEVERAVFLMHVPRLVFLHGSRLFSPAWRSGRSLLWFMHALEVLNYLPTRAWTGHFCGVLARKPIR